MDFLKNNFQSNKGASDKVFLKNIFLKDPQTTIKRHSDVDFWKNIFPSTKGASDKDFFKEYMSRTIGPTHWYF